MKKLALFLAILFVAAIPFGAFADEKEEPPYDGYHNTILGLLPDDNDEPFDQASEESYTITYKVKQNTGYSPDIMWPNGPFKAEDELSITYPEGYVITENDIPVMFMDYGIHYQDNYNMIWEPNPVGYEVHEDKTFEVEFVVTGLYYVSFGDSTRNGIASFSNVPRGTSVEPPKVEEVDDYGVFIRWSSDEYLNVQRNLDIYEIRATVGDVNIDSSINTGDAVMILRSVVGLKTFDRTETLLADVNRDGAVNTGDAAIILSMLLEN